MLLKIGELASRTGLTIRALRHYHDIGLLVPSHRSEGGYRQYDRSDVARLYRIQALRRLDLSLVEIQAILAGDAASLPELVAQQIAFLERQIRQASALQTHLLALQAQLEARTEPAIDDWLAALESMVAGSKYFSADEIALLKAHRELAPAAAESDKAALADALKALLGRGAAADSKEAGELAHRWIELLLAEVGDDEGLLIKLYMMHWHEAGLRSLTGVDQAGMQFISHAMAYRRLDIYARYCSPDEMVRLRAHYVEQTAAWPPLITALREHMAKKSPPQSPSVQALAHSWKLLSLAKAGGDPGIQLKLQTAFQNEAVLRRGSGIDAALLVYLDAAFQALEHPVN